MYVFIANGYKGIIESKQTLDVLASIYPYPKYRKVRSREDAIRFMARYDRGAVQVSFDNYGNTDKKCGYADIVYVIDNKDLYINIDTSRVGFIRVNPSNFKDTVVDNRFNMVRIKISSINLNNELISDHCVAISSILNILGGFVDVTINIPDISIYLALTKYTGDSYIIKDVQNTIKTRLGGVSLTIN